MQKLIARQTGVCLFLALFSTIIRADTGLVGGIIPSTLLTLVVLPALYLLVHARDRREGRPEGQTQLADNDHMGEQHV